MKLKKKKNQTVSKHPVIQKKKRLKMFRGIQKYLVLNKVKFIMSSNLMKKTIRHAKKQENMSCSEEKNLSMETN